MRLPVLTDLGASAQDSWQTGRILSGFVRGKPMHCIVQVSNRCNLTCDFCAFWEHPAHPQDEMTVDDFQRISAQLSLGGSMVISLEGGEPLLRPDITQIVRAFARYHFPILFTNGWRVTAQLARDLWAAGLTQIGVSIDYATPARHDDHRGKPGTFEAARKALAILRDTAPRGRRQVNVMTVVMHDNIDEMEALLRLSENLRVNHQCTIISTTGDGRADRGKHRPPPLAGARLLELKRRYPHFISFTGYLEGAQRFLQGNVRTPCWAGERFLNIDHLGNVSPCIEKLHLNAGNLRRDDWSVVAEKLSSFAETKTCTSCYTSCRGFVEEMSGAPSLRSWREFLGGFANSRTS